MQDNPSVEQHNHLHQHAAASDRFYKFSDFDELNVKIDQPLVEEPQNNNLLFQSPFVFNVSFSTSQIACICRTLYLNREGEKLTQFFETQQTRQLCDPSQFLNNNEINSHDSAAIFCAYLFALCCRGNYEELFERITYSKLDSQYHGELQRLWYEAHYAEDQEKKTKMLGPVDKYRIRHKNPPPNSIWDGEKVVYTFKERQRKILMEYYRRNRYPKPDEKQEIALRTGLKMAQIANWFKNKRQRNKTSLPSNDLLTSSSALDLDSLNINTINFF